MAQILIDQDAEADLVAIVTAIGIDRKSPMAARRFLADIQRKFELHAQMPAMGELRPEFGNVRCFTFRKKFVVVYRPLDDGIDVLRVLHGGRDYPHLFPNA
jgi:toxin ParE1/3/4